VTLEDYRNYDALSVALDPGFNILAGRNAQGKTNFLEALYLLATTRLLRGQRDAEAVRDGAHRAVVIAETADGRSQIAMTIERGVRKRATLNGMGLPRASDLIGRLPCVSISSADLAIVRGDPADRRMFLDMELSALYPAYLRHFTLYKRALEQRNALLRAARENHIAAALYEPWEAQIAEHGSSMRSARRAFVHGLSPMVAATHGRMGSGEQLRLDYQLRDHDGDAEVLRGAMERTRDSDVSRGGTSVGPHRDDLLVEIDGREARLFGSQGQQRTSVIALKLATLLHARDLRGKAPLLLLDDILSDLDERRRALLVEVVLECSGQAVLTCTEAEAAGRRILDRARIFEVAAGNVRRL
jgi:DNA replication and repair protein RecF